MITADRVTAFDQRHSRSGLVSREGERDEPILETAADEGVINIVHVRLDAYARCGLHTLEPVQRQAKRSEHGTESE